MNVRPETSITGQVVIPKSVALPIQPKSTNILHLRKPIQTKIQQTWIQYSNKIKGADENRAGGGDAWSFTRLQL